MRLSRRVPSSRGEESYAEKLYAIQASKASLQQRSSVGGRSRPSGNLTPALSGRHSGTSRGSSSRSAAMIDACVSLRHGFSTTPHTSSPSQSSTSVTSGVSRQWSTASSTELRRARAVDVCQTPAPGDVRHSRATHIKCCVADDSCVPDGSDEGTLLSHASTFSDFRSSTSTDCSLTGGTSSERRWPEGGIGWRCSTSDPDLPTNGTTRTASGSRSRIFVVERSAVFKPAGDIGPDVEPHTSSEFTRLSQRSQFSNRRSVPFMKSAAAESRAERRRSPDAVPLCTARSFRAASAPALLTTSFGLQVSSSKSRTPSTRRSRSQAVSPGPPARVPLRPERDTDEPRNPTGKRRRSSRSQKSERAPLSFLFRSC